MNILTATPVCSPAAQALANGMLAQQFSPLFPIELVEKDLGCLTATGQAQQADLPIGDAARRVFQKALIQGYAADNITGVAQLYMK